MLDEHTMKDLEMRLDMAREYIQGFEKGLGKIDIKGKEYSTVGLRVLALRKYFGARLQISTEIIERTDETVCMKATIRYIDGSDNIIKLSDGYAEKKRNESMITRKSCVEFCQTTAVGRACAMLGLLGNSEIASVDEMSIADNNTKDNVVSITKGSNDDDLD